MDEIVKCLAVPAALLLGIGFLFVFSLMIRRAGDETHAENVEYTRVNAQVKRNAELVQLATEIQQAPKRDQPALLRALKEKQSLYREMDKQDRHAIVNAKMPYDQQTAYDVRMGVRYAKPEKTRAARLRERRAGR